METLDSNSGKATNKLGQIESKEENIKNLAKAKDHLQKQDAQISMIRDGVKQMGSSISEGISREKMDEIEGREREKEQQRLQKEQELNAYIANLKQDRKSMTQEISKLDVEISAN